MTDKLKKLREQHETEEHNLQVDTVKERRKAEAFMFLGGIHTVGKIANALKSQEIRGLEAIQTEKIYLDLGFDTFNDFLNSEYSPISKSGFYEKYKLLEKESDRVFDLLNEVGVAASTRKLIASGDYDAIQVEGDIVKIGDRSAELSNFKTIKALIESYAEDCKRLKEENTKQSEKLTKGKEDFDRLKQRLVETENSVSHVDYSKNPIAKTNAIALGGLASLADELSNATIVECQNFAESHLRLLASQYNRVQKILAEKLGTESVDELLISQNEEDRMTSLLDDED